MILFFINMALVLGVMWILARWLYPKPPKHFLPQAGDDTTLKVCSVCGVQLAAYRGVVAGEHFFCNYEHALVAIRRDDSIKTKLSQADAKRIANIATQ